MIRQPRHDARTEVRRPVPVRVAPSGRDHVRRVAEHAFEAAAGDRREQVARQQLHAVQAVERGVEAREVDGPLRQVDPGHGRPARRDGQAHRAVAAPQVEQPAASDGHRVLREVPGDRARGGHVVELAAGVPPAQVRADQQLAERLETDGGPQVRAVLAGQAAGHQRLHPGSAQPRPQGRRRDGLLGREEAQQQRQGGVAADPSLEVGAAEPAQLL